MTDKEQIIVDGESENCKILFRCKHINDLKAYDMIRNGIKITPENAPVDDFDLMLIENTDSPFGFSSVCKRNSKENVWEYSGFGHSGACSIVTALLKQLARKTQELEVICKAFDIEYAYDDDGKIFGRSNKLRSLEQECESLKEEIEILKDNFDTVTQDCNELIEELRQKCEELKAEKEVIKKYLGISDKPIMQRLEELTEYKLKRQLKYIKIQEENDRYRKALEEIAGISATSLSDDHDPAEGLYGEMIKILDIINKAKS